MFDAAATAATTPADDEVGPLRQARVDYLDRNRAAWEKLGPAYIVDGRNAWRGDEPRWGLWGIPESDLRLLDGFGSGENAIELGCGTAAISAWLARGGLRPVAVDFALAQIQNVETLQHEFDLRFPIIRSDAEQVPFDDESFDLAISDYGASLWCDPRLWLPEANRLLRPEGRLIFVTNSALLLTCTPTQGGPVSDCLVREHFSRYRVEFDDEGPVEFHLTHSDWIRTLRHSGFVIDDLIEVQPDAHAKPRFDFVSVDWARRWPSEEIWVTHKAS